MYSSHSLGSLLPLLGGYGVVGLFLCWLSAILLRRDPRNLIRRPSATFFGTMMLVHAIMPIAELLAGTYGLENHYSMEAHIAGWGVTLLGATGVFIGTLVVGRRRCGLCAERPLRMPHHEILSFVLFIALPSLYACYELYQVVAQVGYEEFLRDRIGYRVGAQAWVLLSNMVVVVPAFFVAVYLVRQRDRRSLIFAIASFLVSAFFILATGSRNSVFLSLLCGVLTYVNFSTRILSRRTLKVMAVVVCAGGLLALYGQYRRAVVRDDHVNIDARSLVDASAGAFGNHELVLWLAENPSERHYGVSYLAGFTFFIPREFWPDKLLGGGPRIRNAVTPGAYVVGRRGNSSYTTGFLVEAWMNFGALGVFPVGVAIGWMLAVIGLLVRRADSPYAITLASYLVLSAAVLIVYSEFLGWMARVVPVVVGLLVARTAGRIFFGRFTLAKRRGSQLVQEPQLPGVHPTAVPWIEKP